MDLRDLKEHRPAAELTRVIPSQPTALPPAAASATGQRCWEQETIPGVSPTTPASPHGARLLLHFCSCRTRLESIILRPPPPPLPKGLGSSLAAPLRLIFVQKQIYPCCPLPLKFSWSLAQATARPRQRPRPTWSHLISLLSPSSMLYLHLCLALQADLSSAGERCYHAPQGLLGPFIWVLTGLSSSLGQVGAHPTVQLVGASPVPGAQLIPEEARKVGRKTPEQAESRPRAKGGG